MRDRGRFRQIGGARDLRGKGRLPPGAGHGLNSADESSSCACSLAPFT